MPVKIIIRENGKQCMMQMPVKTTLRLYCDDSRLVFKCMQIHQFIATQLPCYYSFVIKMPLKNHVKYVWKQEVPLPQQRLLLCIHVRGGHQRPTQAYRPQIFYYLLSYLLHLSCRRICFEPFCICPFCCVRKQTTIWGKRNTNSKL